MVLAELCNGINVYATGGTMNNGALEPLDLTWVAGVITSLKCEIILELFDLRLAFGRLRFTYSSDGLFGVWQHRFGSWCFLSVNFWFVA